MKSTKFALLVAAAALAQSAGCTGESPVRDRPETLERLALAEQAVKDKDGLIKQLNAQIVELQDGAKVVVSMEGPRDNGQPGAIVEVVAGTPTPGGGGGGGGGGGSARDDELYATFLKKLGGSQGSIKKCYETELKRRPELETRSINLKISVDYKRDGEVSGTRLKPRISDNFARCMSTVARRWRLPAMPAPSSFNYVQRLTPR